MMGILQMKILIMIQFLHIQFKFQFQIFIGGITMNETWCAVINVAFGATANMGGRALNWHETSV